MPRSPGWDLWVEGNNLMLKVAPPGSVLIVR
jgi:hypothetical protein